MIDTDGGFWDLWYLSGDLAYDLEEMLEKDPSCLPDNVKHDLKSMNAAGDDADPAGVLGVLRAAREVLAIHDDGRCAAMNRLSAAMARLDKENTNDQTPVS